MKTWPATRLIIAAATLVAAPVIGFATPAYCDTTCTGDTCVVNNDVQTPAGRVTVFVTPDDAVTVHLTPTAANTVVYGIPFQLPPGPPCAELPPGPPCIPGYSRTSIATASAGTVNVDVFLSSGSADAPSLPTIVIISIHPPGPCRSRTIGSTVTFTPITSHR